MAFKKIGEHNIEIPDWKPGMELLNEGLPAKDCKWRRIQFPKLFFDVTANTEIFSLLGTVYNEEKELKSLSVEDSNYIEGLVKRDIERRLFGVHIKIKNRIEWIAPDYYYFLQWFQQMDIKADAEGNRYGSFRKIQNDILQLWEHVKWNPEIAGLIVPKIKKCGITYLFCGAFLNEITLTRNNLFLLMSKDNTTCKITQFAFIKYGYENLPYLIKPVDSKMNESEIVLGKPTDKAKQKKGTYLMNSLRACKTKSAAFDGPVPFRCWWDEFPKTWEASKVGVKKTFDKSLEAIKINQFINGKLLMTSYMNEEADAGFNEAKVICERSLLKTIKGDNKRTESQMIIFPVYAYMSNQESFDEYGDCDEEKADNLTKRELATKVTRADIIKHKRQYPRNWSDMFDNTGAGTAFDNVRLGLRDSQLLDLDIQGIREYIEGNLRWVNSSWEEGVRPLGQFCEVYFEPLTVQEIADGKVGSFRLFYDLNKYPRLKPILNRVVRENVKRNGLYAPHPDNLGVSSIDPVDYKLASDVRVGSSNGSYGGFVFDQNLDSIAKCPISNVPLYEYDYRHEDPDKILEDMIKATIYWGFCCLIENNKGWLYTEFKKHQLKQFLIVRQADNSITPWKDYAEFHGGNKPISTDEKMINAYCRAIATYIAEPKKDCVDYLMLIKGIPSVDTKQKHSLIGQLMEFDPMNTRRFDLAVAFGYWRVAIENYEIWLLSNKSENNTGNTLTPQQLEAILQ